MSSHGFRQGEIVKYTNCANNPFTLLRGYFNKILKYSKV